MRIDELGGHSMLVSDEEKCKGHGQAERRRHQRALCRARGPGARGTPPARTTSSGGRTEPWREGPKRGLSWRTTLTGRASCLWEDRADTLLCTSWALCDQDPHMGAENHRNISSHGLETASPRSRSRGGRLPRKPTGEGPSCLLHLLVEPTPVVLLVWRTHHSRGVSSSPDPGHWIRAHPNDLF